MKSLLYITIFFSFIGEQWLTLAVGSYQLSVFRICLLLLLFGWLILGRDRKLIASKANRYSLLFMLAWGFWGFVSFFWAQDTQGWVRGLFFLAQGVTLSFACNMYLESANDLRNILVVMMAGICVQTVLGWFEVLTGKYSFISSVAVLEVIQGQNLHQPVAMAGNPNGFATLMLFGIVVSLLTLLNRYNKPAVRVVALFMVANCTVLLFLTDSRANELGLVLGVVIFMLISKKHVGCAVLFGLVAVDMLLGGPLSIFVSEQFDFRLVEGQSTSIRVALIENGIQFLQVTHGIGVGLGQIEYWMAHFAGGSTEGFVNMHNWWVEIAVSFGLLVFVGYVVFYIKLIVDNMRHSKHAITNDGRQVGRILVAFLAALAVGLVSSSSNMGVDWLWAMWGVLVAWQGMLNVKKSMGRDAKITH